MAITKYASFAILDAEMAASGPLRAQAGIKTAHRHEFDYEPREGYLYVRSRAISSRCNDNYDEFPGDEITKAYRSFVGKPVFVNHNNDDHRRARGVITDAALHEDTNPDGTEDTWVEVLMEVDAVRFPKLAQAILAGEIDRTSMGTDVVYSLCSFCGNKAATPLDYCKHIPKLKGQRIRRRTASGSTEDVLVREICYGLRFFENSLLVEDPADPTALCLGVAWAGEEPPISGNVDPRYASRYLPDQSGRHAELGTDLSVSQLASPRASLAGGGQGQQVPLDDENVGLRQTAYRVPRSNEAASSGHHVGGVVGVGAEEPVARVLAGRQVAGVPYDVIRSEWSTQQDVAVPMGTNARSFGVGSAEATVATLEGASGPGPADLWPSAPVYLREVSTGFVHGGNGSADPAFFLDVDDRGVGGGYRGNLRTAKTARRLYHVTTDPNFALDPSFVPEDAYGDQAGNARRAGVYLTDDPERWKSWARSHGSETWVVPIELSDEAKLDVDYEEDTYLREVFAWNLGVVKVVGSPKKISVKTAVVPSDDLWTEEDERKHPRKGDGKFTDGPDQNNGSANTKTLADEGKAEPEPETADGSDVAAEGVWSDPGTKGSGSKEDPVQTGNVDDAAKALAEGKLVNLSQPRQVATLLDKLKLKIEEAKAAGGKLDINLCDVTVQGTNLFCVESKGIPRVQMPQLKVRDVPPDSRAAKEITQTSDGEYDLQPLFLKQMRSKGLKTVTTTVNASMLKATQSELNAGKIAGMTDAVQGGATLGEEPIFVSNDDYIVDGHHRWAAYVAADYDDGEAGDIQLPVTLIDMDIISLLSEANSFAESYGVKGKAVNASKKPCCQGCTGAHMPKTAGTIRRTAASAADLQHMSEVVTRTLGHYNAAVTWLLQNVPDASAERVANAIADRDAPAVRKMTGTEGWMKDYDDWWPKMVAATQTMLDEIRGGRTAAKLNMQKCDICEDSITFSDGEWIDRSGRGWVQSPHAHNHVPSGRAASKHAVGEQVAPSEVDTMRQDLCPVCGEKDSYDGDRCSVCSFIKPPEMFDEPDLEKAKQQDLRQDQADAAGVSVDGDPMEQGVDSALPTDDLTFVPPDDPAPDALAPDDEPVGIEDEDEDEDEDDPDDEDEEDAEDDEEGSDKPDFLKKKKDKKVKKKPGATVSAHSQKGISMGTTTNRAARERRLLKAAMAEQQVAIEALGATLDRVANVAGIDVSDLKRHANKRIASIRRQADAANPAQPVPDPAAEAPVAGATTEEALGDLNGDDLEAIGPTGTTDVSPDATTNLSDTGTVLDEPLDLNEQDPTKPVAGTEGPLPLSDVKTETEVRSSEGDNTSVAFPLQGPFSKQPTTGARVMASLRLARARIAAGIEAGDDLAVADAIANDRSISAQAIQDEIKTLSRVVTANRNQQRPPHLVPRSAGGRTANREVPSFGSVPPMEVLASAAGSVNPDEVLFEG